MTSPAPLTCQIIEILKPEPGWEKVADSKDVRRVLVLLRYIL